MSPEKDLVIIVEDEPDTAEMFAELLKLEGYRVKKAYGGTAGIDFLSKERPDAVLLDLMMPDVSGLEVLRYIRRDPNLENIPVVIVSGRPMPAELKDDLENTATTYLMKPVGIAQITQALSEAVKKSEM